MRAWRTCGIPCVGTIVPQRNMDRDKNKTPLQRARALWTPAALELSSTRFRELFDDTYGRTEDLETRWQLGGALNDYLRRRPHTVPVPLDLPWQLLRSHDADARIIGLKLLKHCDVSDVARLDELVRAIKRDDNYESDGGLFELGQYLENCRDNGRRIPTLSADRLQEALKRARDRDDDNRQKWVDALSHTLRTLVG